MKFKKQKMERSQEILFLGIVCLFWFAQYVYIPYQTMYLSGIGISGSVIGVIVGAYGISQMLLRLPVGVCADRIGQHKKFILIGAGSSGLASFFRICLDGEKGFFFGNLFSGLASAMWISYMVFYTGQFEKDEQQKATSRIVMFNNIGMLLGFIVSTLGYSVMGMRWLCIFSCIAGCLACSLACLIKEQPSKRGDLSVGQLLGVCRGKQILMFSFVALIQQGIQLTTTMSFTNQIIKNLGVNDQLIGLSSIIYMLSAVGFSALASSKICSKKGPRFWIPMVLALLAAYCILVPSVGNVLVIFVLQILPGMATGILFSYATSEAMKDVPAEKKSTAMGFFQAFYAIGMTAFPMLTGKIVGIYGMKAGYFVLAGIALAGSMLSLGYYRTVKK